MPNAQLTWQQSAVLAVVLFGAAAVVRFTVRPERPLRRVAPFVREAGVIASLYALWMLAGSLAEGRTAGAFSRARWIHHTERRLGLPSETSLQDWLLSHRLLAQGANLYYATMHFTALFVFLFWVFWRHRERYRAVRTTVVGFTALSLLIQFVPVAPPRLLPELGFVDVAAHYGQSVYTLGVLSADQLSAMPSVHVGWAVLIGVAVVRISRSRWRWLFLLHTVLTVLIVSATANHWWADGIVATALVALVAGVQMWWGRLRRVATTASEDHRGRDATMSVPAGVSAADDLDRLPV